MQNGGKPARLNLQHAGPGNYLCDLPCGRYAVTGRRRVDRRNRRAVARLDNTSAREAPTCVYAPHVAYRQNGSGPPPEETDDGPGDTEKPYESRCAAPMRTDDTQSEPANKGPVTK